MSSPNNKAVEPKKLSGLKQAMYILDCLHDGLSEGQIIASCDGDGQLVKIWIDFLKDNRWVIKDDANKRWVLTDKGKEQMISYYQV